MVKISSLLKAFIIICTLIMLRYPLLLPGDTISNSLILQGVIVAFSGIVLALLTLLSIPNRYKVYYRWLFRYLAPYMAVIIFSVMYTSYLYGYSLTEVLRCSFPFLYVFFAIPLIYIFCCDKSCVAFVEVIVLMQVAMLGIKAVAWFFYNYASMPLFTNLVLEFGVWVRDGLQRIEQGQLYGLALVISTCFAVQRKFRAKYAIIAFGIVLFIAVITQSRNGLATSIATVGVICYFANGKGLKKVWMRALVISGIIVVALSGMVSELIESASVTGQYSRSTITRVNNFNYYFGLLLNKRRIFGLGLLDQMNDMARDILFYSKNRQYYLDDLGLLGGVVRFGVLSIVIYGWLFILVGRACWTCYKNKNYQYFPLLIGIAAYMAISCLMQNLFDMQRAYGTSFYLAIVSYIDATTRKHSIQTV